MKKRDPYDISTWGPECGRGFVSSERFARPGDIVIKRTNREVTRRWRKCNDIQPSRHKEPL